MVKANAKVTETYSAEEADALSSMYALLSRIWLQEVDEPFIRQLQAEPLGRAFRDAGGIVPKVVDVERLAAEYCRLFIGPKDHLPPFQSVWAQGALNTEITNSVRAFAEAVSYGPAADATNSLSDHLGTQLAIMSKAWLLIGVEAGNVPLRELAAEFYRRHLTWPYQMFESAKQRGEEPFYTAVVQMTEDFLQAELNRFPQK